MNYLKIEEIKKVFAPWNGSYEMVLFGSAVEGGMRPTSDIDIAVLSRSQDKEMNLKLQKEFLGQYPSRFDIHIFELFPIYIQISIVQNYKIIFGNPLEISEYFYDFRKKWDDCKFRIMSNQFSSYRERLSLIKSENKTN